MWKVCVLLVVSLVMEMLVSSSEALVVNKKLRKKAKKMKAGEMVNQLTSLQKNVSSLWTEMHDMESSRVMVHVHGLGDDPAETHEGQDGTHVHIHMHLGGPHGGPHGDRHDDHHDDHDDHRNHPHSDHHGHMDAMGGGMGGEGHGDHSNHGHHGYVGMMKGMHVPMKMKMKMRNMHQHMHFPTENTYVYGHCEMGMNPSLKRSPHTIKGAIHLRQKMHGPLEILLHLKGFNVPKGAHTDHSMHTHGFHVHQYGDFSDGCQSFGGHYNPDGVKHSAKNESIRHAGDWGNIACDARGEVHTNMTDNHTSLVGTHSIMGRGLVIHEHQDDLGKGGDPASLKTGNAGGRLACCTIAWSGEHDWPTLLRHEH